VRGLTDEDRSALERWSRGTYVSVEMGTLADPPIGPLARSLFERGLATWVSYPAIGGWRAVTTTMGELALRADAAARSAGVWP
jgi:hypothetical protein